MENYRLHLTAIFKAIGAAQTFTAGMDFEAFVDDDKTASAVVQKLEIVGEAVKNVPEMIRQKYPHVPWQQMADRGDLLIHEYYNVNSTIVWEIVTELIPPLQLIIKQILKDMEGDAARE